MTWIQFLFGFRGRINRARFWAVLGIIYVASTVAGVLLVALLSLVFPEGSYQEVPASMLVAFLAFVIPVNVVVFLSVASACVRRLHDRNKSGWWLLVLYGLTCLITGIAALISTVPGLQFSPVSFAAGFASVLLIFAFSAWAIVEMGCLPGTRGENRYGPDPLANANEATA